MTNASAEVRAIFSNLKDKRIKFYQEMIKEFDEYDEFSMKIERVLAYQIQLRNIRIESLDFKERLIAEIENLQGGEVLN